MRDDIIEKRILTDDKDMTTIIIIRDCNFFVLQLYEPKRKKLKCIYILFLRLVVEHVAIAT